MAHYLVVNPNIKVEDNINLKELLQKEKINIRKKEKSPERLP